MTRSSPFWFRIGARILLLNVLIVFVPITVLLLLDTYETQLLDTLERSLVQQARTVAAALAIDDSLDSARAVAMLRALEGRHESRIRVVDAGGELLADTSTLGVSDAGSGPAGSNGPSAADPPTAANPATVPGAVADPDPARSSISGRSVSAPRERFLYRVASAPVRWFRSIAGEPGPPLPSADFYAERSYSQGSEIVAALDGRYGAATRVSSGGQISVTLYSAIPVRQRGEISGAVLASQSTYRLLQNLYELRLNLFAVFLVSLALAIILSLFLSLTIARPLARLERQATTAVDKHGRLTTPILPVRRRDEIGSLSIVLSELTEQIERHTERLEGFAADVAHELKNPLASIRASTELARETGDPAVRDRFLARVLSDVQRSQRIIEAIRDLSHIDSNPDSESRTRILAPINASAEWFGSAYPLHKLDLAVKDTGRAPEPVVPISEHRLRQAIDNLLDNAAGFSPDGSVVKLGVRTDGQAVIITVGDCGPGIHAGDEERVFSRFYSTRTDGADHVGLGLSIVRSIVGQANGVVRAQNAASGGAVFEMHIPTADDPPILLD